MVLQLVVGPHEKEKEKSFTPTPTPLPGSSGRRDNHRLNMRCRTLSLSFSLLGTTTRLFLVRLLALLTTDVVAGPPQKPSQSRV
jgi:hypothetical protein